MTIISFILVLIFALIAFYSKVVEQTQNMSFRVTVYISLFVLSISIFPLLGLLENYSFIVNGTLSVLIIFLLNFSATLKLKPFFRWALALPVLISAVITFVRGSDIETGFVYYCLSFLFSVISFILTNMVPKREVLFVHIPVFTVLIAQLYNAFSIIMFRHNLH